MTSIFNNIPVVILVFFFAIFVFIILWIFTGNRRRKIEEHKNIPFLDGEL